MIARRDGLARLHAALEEHGLLLDSDAVLPNAASIILGEPVRGSWWGHPRGGEIYKALIEFHADPAVLTAPLIDDKSTAVHRRLWPAFLAVATAVDAWQTEGLGEAALELFAEVTRHGEIRLDAVAAPGTPEAKQAAKDARLLERGLLTAGWNMHTERGAHTKCLATWERWMEMAAYAPPEPLPSDAMEQLNAVLVRLNERFGAAARYRWSPRPRRRPR